MKKVIIILTICFSITVLNGQDFPFPQDSASWTYLERGWDDNGTEFQPSYITVTLFGDTIINEINYKKVTSEIDRCHQSNTGNHDFVRVENGKVYILDFHDDTSKEVILYDFTLEVGDTMFNRQCVEGFPPGDSVLIIREVTTTLINGSNRKTWDISEGFWEPYLWLDGIGNVNTLLTDPFYLSQGVLNQVEHRLLCFYQNGAPIIQDTFHYYIPPEEFQPEVSLYYSCEGLVTALNEPKNQDKIKVYPNPTSALLNITLINNSETIQQVQLINLMGEVMMHEFYEYSTSIEVDASGWASGIYYVVVNGLWVEKVVVQ